VCEGELFLTNFESEGHKKFQFFKKKIEGKTDTSIFGIDSFFCAMPMTQVLGFLRHAFVSGNIILVSTP